MHVSAERRSFCHDLFANRHCTEDIAEEILHTPDMAKLLLAGTVQIVQFVGCRFQNEEDRLGAARETSFQSMSAIAVKLYERSFLVRMMEDWQLQYLLTK